MLPLHRSFPALVIFPGSTSGADGQLFGLSAGSLPGYTLRSNPDLSPNNVDYTNNLLFHSNTFFVLLY